MRSTLPLLSSPRVRGGLVASGLAAALLVPVTALPNGSPFSVASADWDEDKARGEQAVQEAATHEGKPYQYGAAGPDSFDCSGFVQYVYGQLGVSLPRTSQDQYDSLAKKISPEHLQLGDLIFMKYDGQISHVGIYAGENTFWVARTEGTTITRQELWTSDYLIARV